MGTQAKLEYLLLGCQRRGLTVLLCQETFLEGSSGLFVPERWELFSFPHPTMRRRRGLAILVDKQRLKQLGWAATHVAEASTGTAGHDYLAVRVGPWLMASVYVACTDADGRTITRPDYQRLTEDLALLQRDAGDQLLVAGDFNGGGKHAPLNRAMADVLGLQPLLEPTLATRYKPNKPLEGSLLDNVYYPHDSAAALHALEPFDAIERLGPLAEDDIDDAEPMGVQDVSDHLLVAACLPTPGMELPEEDAAEPRPRPERRIRWKKLDELERVASKGDEPAKSEAKAKLKAIGERIAAISTLDLAEANELFLALCREELGTYQPRSGPRHAFMSHPAVKTALRKSQKARKRFYRARQRKQPALVVARLQALANAADREWRKERDEAIRQTKEADQGRMAEGGADTSFFRRYRSARGVKRRLDPTRHLDPTATAAFWTAVFNSTAPPVSEREPYCDEVDVVITAKMVLKALKQMERSCVGPDGLDFRFLRRFAGPLAEVLAKCFTSAISQGLPAALRRSTTQLFPKGETVSADPAAYRPITLLPMVVRVLHKVLENMFRGAMFSSTEGRPQLVLQQTQAGFMPGRNTYEQAALLQIIQSVFKEGSDGSARQLLCGIFLDIRKAFDSMEYGQLLDILESRQRLPQAWLEILRRFLPGNSTTIMGVVVYFLRGLPQGGALCPLLCDAFMDDLACELAEYLEQHPSLGPLWRKSQTQDGHKWSLPHVKSLWLRLLQFADDIAILAATPEEAQELLDVVAAWGRKRGLEFSDKSFAVLLSRPIGSAAAAAEMPELRVGELPLTWAPADQPFRYLGVTTQAATSHGHSQLQGHTRAALKEKKAERNLNAMRPIFRVSKGKHLVVPVALRRGIEMVVYAGALYDTALVDTDYDRLDRMVMAVTRQILQVPPNTPSAYLRCELRLWNAELRAHKRAMHLAAQLWHESWIGKEILRHYLLERPHRDHHDPAGHPFFKIGPQARLERILAMYGYDWARVNTSLVYEDDEKVKARLSEKLTDLLEPVFASRVRDKARETKGMPEHHRHEMLEHMGLPPPEQERDGLPLQAHVRHDLPLYLYIGRDLPRAGIWTRMPYLRLQRRGEDLRRAPCAWCQQPDKEYGHHLLRCKLMPAALRRRRDRVLQLILEDVRRSKAPPEPHETATCHANLDRLFYLYWSGKGSWVKGSKKGPSRRSDCGNQPDREVLTKALWYMRTMINEYRKATARTGPGGSNPVWELPVYGRDPDPDAEQGDGAASAYEVPPALSDSLWRLDSPDE